MLNRQARAESGAILVFTAFLLLVLLGFAALAVDLGNAWSTNRESQTAADIAASSALFAIPRTFDDVAGAPSPIVTTAVQDEIDDLMATNAPGGTAIGTVNTNTFDLTVDVTVDSNNSFSRAIGAGNSITVANTARGHIEIPELVEPNVVRPFSLYNSALQPYQCLMPGTTIPVPNQPQVCQAVNGDDVDFLEMYNLDPVVNCGNPSTISNMRDGIDHYVDTADEHPVSPDPDTRTASDACSYGHPLTLPNNADIDVVSTGQLTSGLTQGAGGLNGASTPLWDLLVAGLPGDCNDAQFPPLAPPTVTVEQLSNQMRSCLQSGAAQFQSGVVTSPRFSWAIRTSAGPGGSRDFEDLTLLFLNSVVYDGGALAPEEAQQLNGPQPGFGQVGAVTMFELQPEYLSAADQAILMEPAGTDLLEFELTN